MAKPLSAKSLLIREAITNNNDIGNKEIAELLNGHEDRKKDKIEVKASDVAQQKQQLKKPSGTAPSAAEETSKKETSAAPQQRAFFPAQPVLASPVALIDQTLDLAQQCGGIHELKKLVERLADMQPR